MRNGQKRMRGRSNNNNNNQGHGGHRKSQNPLTRVYESNGPDVKIRGTASHIAEKYIQLARDSQSSGDPVAAENYYQHAEHYFRLIAAAQEQFRQQNPFQGNQPQQGGQQSQQTGGADDNYADSDDDQPFMGQNEPSYAPQPQPPVQQAQPYLPRDAQPFPPRDQQQPRQQQPYRQPPNAAPELNGLPAFITGGGQPQPAAQPAQNGAEGERQERFGSHHRRRRHRGPGNFRQERPDNFGNTAAAEGGEEPRQPE